MLKEGSVLSEFYAARKNAILKKNEEEIDLKKGESPWGIFASGLESFNGSFSTVLGKTIEVYLAEKKQSLGSAYVLEAMGQGAFFNEVDIDGGLALTLADPKNPVDFQGSNSPNTKIIAGDILQGAIWRQIRNYMRDHEASMNGGFDLIVCRPLLGWDVLKERAKTVPEDFPEQVVANKLFKS